MGLPALVAKRNKNIAYRGSESQNLIKRTENLAIPKRFFNEQFYYEKRNAKIERSENKI